MILEACRMTKFLRKGTYECPGDRVSYPSTEHTSRLTPCPDGTEPSLSGGGDRARPLAGIGMLSGPLERTIEARSFDVATVLETPGGTSDDTADPEPRSTHLPPGRRCRPGRGLAGHFRPGGAGQEPRRHSPAPAGTDGRESDHDRPGRFSRRCSRARIRQPALDPAGRRRGNHLP